MWSFAGGRVAIQAEAGGTLAGTVIEPTRFAECPHQIGERMWTDITPQPDGSYAGFHQWFYKGSGCAPNPTPGATAWRLLTAGADRILRVCLGEPGEPAPTIAADGAGSAGSLCFDSAPISSLPVATPAEFLGAGPAACIAGDRRLRLRIRNPRGNPLARIVVAVKGGGIRKNFRLKPVPRSFVASLDLTPIVAPTVRATVRLTTVLGAHLRHRGVYRRC